MSPFWPFWVSLHTNQQVSLSTWESERLVSFQSESKVLFPTQQQVQFLQTSYKPTSLHASNFALIVGIDRYQHQNLVPRSASNTFVA